VAARAFPTIAWRPVLVAGVVAGAIDIGYACGFWVVRAGTPPTRILQSVAAGLLGPAAFVGGLAAAALGLLLHFAIAVVVAVVFVTTARRWPALARQPWRWGLLYGLAVYVVMNHVVVPLSAAGGGGAGDPLWVSLTVLVHAVGIGVPVAFGAQRALRAS
jgi:uncharacterized membrane protein YagU involved in acid resistance